MVASRRGLYLKGPKQEVYDQSGGIHALEAARRAGVWPSRDSMVTLSEVRLLCPHFDSSHRRGTSPNVGRVGSFALVISLAALEPFDSAAADERRAPQRPPPRPREGATRLAPSV
jgi:hypothetical protein